MRLKSSDLLELFESSTTVKHIAEKLQTCNGSEDADIILKQMDALDFDVMGLEEDGIINGYIDKKELGDGRCKDYLIIFHPSELISESTPLIELLPILREAPRVFVLERNRVSSIVTRGDLQKAPVRLFLFGLLTLLEMHLLQIIRVHYSDDTWQKHLKPKRLESVQSLWVQRKDRNEALDLADCLQFCDKRELVLRSPEICQLIGIKSRTWGKSLLESAENLRNKLAHAQDIVTGSTWADIIDLANEIEALVRLCEKAH